MAKSISKPLLLTLWLCAPILVVAGLCVWIAVTVRATPVDQAARVGQGARDTGGANAIGELLAGRDPSRRAAENRAVREGLSVRADELDRPLEVLVRVKSDLLAGGEPVLVLVAPNGLKLQRRPLEPQAGGLWSTELQPDDLPLGARYFIATVDGELGEAGEDGQPIAPRPLPLIPREIADGDARPSILLEVTRLAPTKG